MHRLSLFAAVSLLRLGAAHADMIVVQKIEMPGQSGEITMKMKDNLSRIDLLQSISMITDRDTGDMITINHTQKAYMKMPGAAVKSLIEQVKQANPPGESATKLQPTGKKEKINGYDTEEYTANLSDVKMSYWIARSYPNYKSILEDMMKFQKGSLSSVTRGMAPDADDFPGMPIRTHMESPLKTTTTTLVSISMQPVDPKEFSIPDGYKELPMPNFTLPAATAPASHRKATE